MRKKLPLAVISSLTETMHKVKGILERSQQLISQYHNEVTEQVITITIITSITIAWSVICADTEGWQILW